MPVVCHWRSMRLQQQQAGRNDLQKVLLWTAVSRCMQQPDLAAICRMLRVRGRAAAVLHVCIYPKNERVEREGSWCYRAFQNKIIYEVYVEVLNLARQFLAFRSTLASVYLLAPYQMKPRLLEQIPWRYCCSHQVVSFFFRETPFFFSFLVCLFLLQSSFFLLLVHIIWKPACGLKGKVRTADGNEEEKRRKNPVKKIQCF